MGFGGVKDLYSEHTGKAVGASFYYQLLAGIAGSASDGSGTDNRSSGQEAINHAIHDAKAGDIVIIAGKGHENYQILKNETIHFDDREEARKALKEI